MTLTTIYTHYIHLGVNALNDFTCGKIIIYFCIHL